MKFTKSSIFALGAVFALAFTACSDDDKYEVGKPSHGAYFAQDLPTSYTVVPEVTDIADVAVYRVDTESPSNYSLKVSVTPSTDGIIIPSSIQFSGSSLATSLPISYDPEKIVKDTPYKVTITIDGATDYGTGSYSFTFTCGDKAETEPYGDGLVSYYYSLFWNGVDSDLPITHSFVVGKESKQVFTIGDWGYGVDFNIDVDFDAQYTDGSVRAMVSPQFTGYHYGPDDNGNEGDIWVADGYHYWVDARGQDPDEVASKGYLNASYFDEATGEFGLYLKYYLVETPNLGFTMDYEYAQCGKYGDYSVAVNFLGTFTDVAGNSSAMATVTAGSDVAAVKAICVPGKDVDAAIETIIDEGEGVVDVAVGKDVQVYFPIEEGGEYTIVAVSYDSEEAKSYAKTTFTINLGGSGSSDWTKLGEADYADGWVIPAILNDGYSNTDVMWTVPVEQSKTNPDLYRVVGMYNQDFLKSVQGLVFADNVASNAIQIGIFDGNYIKVDPQECGLGIPSVTGDVMIINNPEGFYYEKMIASGDYTFAEVLELFAANDIEAASFNDGVFEFPECWFGGPKMSSTSYNWNTPMTGFLIMPGASAPAKNRVKATRIAAPKAKGIGRVAANRLQKIEHKFLMPCKFSDKQVVRINKSRILRK